MELLKLILVGAALLAVMACAGKQIEQDVAEQAAEQPKHRMHGGVAMKGIQAIGTSSLPEAQKQRLQRLHQRMISETFRIQEETGKLKGVLFETLAAPSYDKRKIEVIKKKLVKLNTQKMDNMFSALDEAEEILGHVPAAERHQLYRSLLHESLPKPTTHGP